MRLLTSAATLVFTMFAASAAFAQTSAATSPDAGISSGVLWAAGIAAFLGFLIGSVPPRGENRGWSFDSQGALMWSFAAAGIVGGGAYINSTGSWFPGLWACLVGAAFGVMRVLMTLPPRVPKNYDLQDGINRAEGADPKSRSKAAKKMFRNASFNNNGWYATRAPREWHFGNAGPNQEMLDMLKETMEDSRPSTFDILVIHVRELPFEPGQPAIIVVRGGSQLQATRVGAGSLTPPSGPALPASSIEAMVGYAWR